MHKKLIVFSNERVTSIQKNLMDCKVTEVEIKSKKLETDIVVLKNIHNMYIDFSRMNIAPYSYNYAYVMEGYQDKHKIRILLSLSKCVFLEIDTQEKEYFLEELCSNHFKLCQTIESIWNANVELDTIHFTEDYFIYEDCIDNAFDHLDKAISCLNELQTNFYIRFKDAFYLTAADFFEGDF